MTMPSETTKKSEKADKPNGNGGNGSASKAPAYYLLLRDIGLPPPSFNVRRTYPEQETKDLALSIKESGGLKTPLTVSEETPGKFILRSGFRRRLALLHLDWQEPVPVMVEKYADETDAMVNNAVENAGRKDVYPFDMAARLFELIKRGVSRESLAAKTTYQIGHIDNLVRAYEKLEPSILAFWSLRKPETAVELPVGKAIIWASKTHDAQLALFKEWKDEKSRKAGNASPTGGAALLPSDTGDGEGSGAGPSPAPAAPGKPVKLKAITSQIEALTLRKSQFKKEAKELKQNGEEAKASKKADAVDELSIQIDTLRWVIGARASL